MTRNRLAMGGEAAVGDDRTKTTPLGERLATYRRRLAIAAILSLTVHLLLFRGLAVARLGSDAPKPADAAGHDALKPIRQPRPAPRDFPLEVSPSARVRPAHERPLDLAARPPDPRRVPTPRPEPPSRVTAQRRPDEPLEAASDPDRPRPVTTDQPRPRRHTPTADAARDDDAETIAVAAEAAAALASPAPAALAPRPAATPSAVVGQWRPREVALLERLASRSQPVTARPIPEPVAVAPGRRTTTDAAAADAAPVDAVPQPAAAATVVAALAPAARAAAATAGDRTALAPRQAADATAADDAPRATAPASRPAAATTGSPAATTARPAVAVAGPAATVTGAAASAAPAAAGATAAPAPAATGIASRGGRDSPGEAASARAASGAAAAADGTIDGGGWTASTIATRGGGGEAGGARDGAGELAGPRRATAAGGSPAVGSAVAATIDVTTPGGRSGGGGGTPAAPAPAPIERLASAGRSALGGAGRATTAGDDDADDGLSVPEAAGAGSASGRRRSSGDGDAGLPRRIAAAALPVEGRVRDVAEAFAGRTGKRGGKVADKAALARADAVVDRGLDFLAASQQADGRWALGRFAGATAADAPKLESDTAATGLALLAFLGAGHDHFDGRHRDTVRRGLEFLLAVQKPDGDLYLPADELSNSCAWLYSHGMASMALCEAVGMTGDPLIKPAAAQACRFIAAGQHPTLGGWRYTPGTDADLSVSGWMLVAVRAGDLAGVATDPGTLPGVRRLIEASASRGDATRYAYNPRKEQQRRSRLSAACMTAVGTLMRLHTGDPATDPRVVEAGRAIAALRPSYGTATEKFRDSYLWYYASQVLVHTGGDDWDRWYASLVDALTAEQETSGPKAGSWDPLAPVPDRWGEYGGRVYVTALHLLALEVPYRHLPTYSARAANR
jgi:hypothetical protein